MLGMNELFAWFCGIIVVLKSSQSAGKSSLIESISRIALPRASGTCTRCPTECTMIQTPDPWKCAVYLRFKYDSYGQPLTGGQRQMPFGGTIEDPAEVKDRVARAQLAILNPDLGNANFPESFLTGEPPTTSAITFSGNTIVLKVSGPEVVDLSFVDLPGIIATSVVGGGEHDVQAVRQLACEYVKNPNALILLTVTCETDPDNQGAYDLVKKYDSTGRRTIGVTTKPDRIEVGQEATWFKLLNNQVMHVENGWYCVKLPGPEQLRQNITWEAAREHETEFFGNPPWVNQFTLRDRYGVPSLTQQLSFLLSELIAEKLPELLKEIERILAETQDRFSRLPSPPSNDPVQEVMGLIWKFERQVDREIGGTPDRGGLIQKINSHGRSFRHDIRASAPIFVPFRVDTERSSASTPPIILFLTDEERDLGTDGTYPILYLNDVESRAKEGNSYRSISRELPDNVPFPVKRELIQAFVELWNSPINSFIAQSDETVHRHFMDISRAHFSKYPSLNRKVNATLKNRRNTLSKNARRYISWLYEMEQQSTFTLNPHYIRDYKQKLSVLYRSYRWKHIGEGALVRRWMATPPRPPSPPRVIRPDPQATILVVETSSPTVEVESYICASSPTYVQTMPHRRPIYAASVVQSAAEIEEEAGKARENKRKLLLERIIDGDTTAAQDLLPLLPTDSSNEAIEIMADVRAYWQVAFKRFADYVSLAIDMEFVRGFGKDLGVALLHDLGISGPKAKDQCAAYVAEPREIAAERENIRHQLDRLETAQSMIEEWQQQAGAPMVAIPVLTVATSGVCDAVKGQSCRADLGVKLALYATSLQRFGKQLPILLPPTLPTIVEIDRIGDGPDYREDRLRRKDGSAQLAREYGIWREQHIPRFYVEATEFSCFGAKDSNNGTGVWVNKQNKGLEIHAWFLCDEAHHGEGIKAGSVDVPQQSQALNLKGCKRRQDDNWRGERSKSGDIESLAHVVKG
ncbi:P-loop containing nucleoside triphosphate hydrolase protein [Clavulina sp. PMI_390]|nr:P-loop containing nucleoside triphosphate hydrolase protein [Clavulina sp. PMI_390]